MSLDVRPKYNLHRVATAPQRLKPARRRAVVKASLPTTSPDASHWTTSKRIRQ
jgi:hypothetical protein